MAEETASRAPTLADVLDAVGRLPSNRKKHDLASAVWKVCRILGRPPEEISAHPRMLARKLNGIAPALHGITPGRWANIRYYLRSALELIRPMLPGRSKTPMSESWAALFAALSRRSDRVRVSRFLRWLSERQIRPDDLLPDHFEAFRAGLVSDSLLKDPEKTWAGFVWTWNHAAAAVPGWPHLILTRKSRQKRVTLDWSAFPPSLLRDRDRYLDCLAGRDFDSEGPPRPVTPRTVATRKYQLQAFASALVSAGREPGSLRLLSDLVSFQAYKDALKVLYDRNAGKSSRAIASLAYALISIARHWVKIDMATLANMSALAKKLKIPRHGLTTKNKERLRQFDDNEAARRFYEIPTLLRRMANIGKLSPPRAADLAEVAVAIAILQAAPVRRHNLASIEIGRHLLKVGRKTHLVFPAVEVKNNTDLEFELPDRVAELIEWYREKHRPSLITVPTIALFPGRKDGSKKGHTLAGKIKRTVFRVAGFTVNAHLFRHIAANQFLKQEPGNYAVPMLVLGHKSINTTVGFYAGHEPKAAAKHFDEVLCRIRDEALNPQPRRGRRRTPSAKTLTSFGSNNSRKTSAQP